MSAEEFGVAMLERVPCDGRSQDWAGSANVRDDSTLVTVELVMEDGTAVRSVVEIMHSADRRQVIGYVSP